MYSVNADIKQLSELLAKSDKHIDTIVIHSKDRLILIFPKIKRQGHLVFLNKGYRSRHS